MKKRSRLSAVATTLNEAFALVFVCLYCVQSWLEAKSVRTWGPSPQRPQPLLLECPEAEALGGEWRTVTLVILLHWRSIHPTTLNGDLSSVKQDTRKLEQLSQRLHGLSCVFSKQTQSNMPSICIALLSFSNGLETSLWNLGRFFCGRTHATLSGPKYWRGSFHTSKNWAEVHSGTERFFKNKTKQIINVMTSEIQFGPVCAWTFHENSVKVSVSFNLSWTCNRFLSLERQCSHCLTGPTPLLLLFYFIFLWDCFKFWIEFFAN